MTLAEENAGLENGEYEVCRQRQCGCAAKMPVTAINPPIVSEGPRHVGSINKYTEVLPRPEFSIQESFCDVRYLRVRRSLNL